MTSDPRIPREPATLPGFAAEQKALLRRSLLTLRRTLDSTRKLQWDEAIGAALLAWCAEKKWTALAVYWPLPGEPDLHAAYAQLAESGVRLALPVVLEKHAPLAFAEWTPGEAMLKDPMGVAVPAERRLLARPPALLLPCVGFNAQRLRLGYGGGYYDRTLEALPRPATCGIAYACLAAEFTGWPYDVALDVILTENGAV